MSTPLEGILRPFADVPPTVYTTPGEGSQTPIRIKIGFKGSIKTLSLSLSITQTSKAGQAHMENPPLSPALAATIQKATY